MGLNSVCLVGRLTKDPELRSVGDNIAVCQFTLAVDKKKKDSGTNFINCVAWRGLGETISKHVKKGSQLGISGYLDQSSYEKGGVKKSYTQVVVDDIMFLSPKSGSSEPKTPSEEVGLFEQKNQDEISPDMIPF